MFTLVNTISDKLSSHLPATAWSYTAPVKPAANIEVGFRSITIHLKGNENKLFDKYYIEYRNTTSEIYQKFTVPSERKITKLSNLTAGTNYTFKVFSVLSEVKSDEFKEISTFTRPEQVSNITVTFTTEHSIHIQWQSPAEGNACYYFVNFTCDSPNSGTKMSKTQNHTTSGLTSTASDLDPGTSCAVYITSRIGDQFGTPLMKELKQTSKEAAPDEVNITESLTEKKAIYIAWDKPLVPNGIVRKYKVLVVDNFEKCLISNNTYLCKSKDCLDSSDGHQCKDIDFFPPNPCGSTVSNESDGLQNSQTTDGLHPFRSYTVHVKAFTRCWGKDISKELQTQTGKPSSAPKAIEIQKNENSINVSWEVLDVKDRNGIITNYTIRYQYDNRTCIYASDGNSVTSYVKNISRNSTSYQIKRLRPYWFYDIAISASTSAGAGPFSNCTAEMCQVRTSETIPGNITSENVSIVTRESNNVALNWSSPCRPNGVIVSYVFDVFDRDTGQTKSDESQFNLTEYTVQNLLPYRNYTIKVAAKTSKGIGHFTSGINVTTKQAQPVQPSDPQPNAQSSSSLKVNWHALPQVDYTGPTKYTVNATDVKNIFAPQACTTSGFNSTSCLVTGLHPFWEYSIEVTATTVEGSATSNPKIGRTAEDTPGPVSKIQLSPENDVKKVRAINVSWEPPREIDRNGVLTKYNIICTSISNGSVRYSTTTGADVSTCQFTKMPPGNYKCTVTAATVIGEGSPFAENTIVRAGAPLAPIETANTLLIKPSSKAVPDDERQISVLLPLSVLLCNTSNGIPERWGVVVVQDGKEDNDPFIGTRAEFEHKRISMYKTWSDVKNADTIPAYIATHPSWKPDCDFLARGKRSRRSPEVTTKPPDEPFIVGSQGECSDGVKYCNGELQPGRSYRVRSFVCTSEGCTETKYSKPISTRPDLTVPVAAGISSAIIVLVIVGVAVFVLRRKQLLCFAKYVEESQSTPQPGGDISLDSIESKNKHLFRPGPLKLVDIPSIVENMHKDTDLLFADAYKLLKERSPNHPMTAAEQQSSRPKNRYTNILPFDHSRVKLRPSDDVEGSDYINANYIPGYKSKREYIATQGPMIATFDDFWRMVWEQNVDTIVMLTKLMEKGRRKCDKYWPDVGEPVYYGDLVVSLQSESDHSDYILKIFEIKLKEQKKIVRHFSYLKWPDMGCPETPQLLLEFVKAVRQYTNGDMRPPSGPTVVHCSAGVGRTGTFIAMDYLLQHIKDHDEVDIFSFVLEMRNHRLNMVQTEDQYVYIHECLKAFITTDEEEEDEVEEEPIYVNTARQEENVYENTTFQKD